MDIPHLPANGSQVATACGGLISLEADTPRAVFQGRWIYFCLPACRQDFEKEPGTSCLAWQIAESKGDRG